MVTDKLRVVMIVDSPGLLGFATDNAKLLASTGKVEPRLLICQDDTPDGDGSVAWQPLAEKSDRVPAGDYDWADITGFQRSLAGREDYFLGRCWQVASSICAQMEDYLAAHPTDCVIVWAGVRLIQRAAASAARQRGVPVVTMETAFFPRLPNTPPDDPGLVLERMRLHVFVWDVVQAPQCGFSQITEEWRQHAVQPGLADFIRGLHESRESKYNRDNIGRYLSVLPHNGLERVGAELTRPEGSRVLLACGQIDHDSNIYFGRHLVRSWRELVEETISRLPEGWELWFKGHPLDTEYLATGEEFTQEMAARCPHFRCLPPSMNIHAAIQAADAVICINSTVGLEATTYGKPAITLGEGFYTHEGFTYRVQDLAALGETIANLPATMTPEHAAARDQFLSYLLYQYLLPVGRPERAVQRIEQAIARQQERPAPPAAAGSKLRYRGLVRYVQALEQMLVAKVYSPDKDRLRKQLEEVRQYVRVLESESSSYARSLEQQLQVVQEYARDLQGAAAEAAGYALELEGKLAAAEAYAASQEQRAGAAEAHAGALASAVEDRDYQIMEFLSSRFYRTTSKLIRLKRRLLGVGRKAG